jgi:hypothetical protein
MQKLGTLFLAVAVYFLMGIGGAAADSENGHPNPDSVVSCFPNGKYRVIASSVPTSINSNECPGFLQSECSPCIRSLEKQGCKVLDAIVTDDDGSDPNATFLLSCKKP